MISMFSFKDMECGNPFCSFPVKWKALWHSDKWDDLRTGLCTQRSRIEPRPGQVTVDKTHFSHNSQSEEMGHSKPNCYNTWRNGWGNPYYHRQQLMDKVIQTPVTEFWH